MVKADIILRSNAIFPGKGESCFSGAVAIKGNKILAVEENTNLEELSDHQTRIMELGDRLVIPGLIDAHFHFFEGAMASSRYMCCEIEDSVSEEDCIRIIKQFADENPDLPRIIGTGWMQLNWGGAPLPSRVSLDKAFPEKPAYLLSGDGHTFWLNTAALKECGITEESRVSFGEIGKNEDGSLNGILIEMEACGLAWNRIYQPDQQMMEKTQIDFSNETLRYGLTSLCNMTSKPYHIGEEILYKTAFRLSEKNRIKSRLHLYPSLGIGTNFDKQKKLREKYCTEKFRICGLKQFVDGVTSAYTGYLKEPYSDNPSTCGITNFPAEVLEQSIFAANKEGFSVRLHTIADGSVQMALDIFEKAKEINHTEVRNGLEHCENIDMEDIFRFKKMDVFSSMQPIHLILDAGEKVIRIGKERAKMEWPYKTLLRHGAVLAFGTDYPVAHFNPFPNIQAAVTRSDKNGNPIGVNPEECLSVAEALTAYTYGGAYSFNREKELGSLEPGKLADIVILEENLFNIDPYKIKDCSVYLTILDGEIVYQKT